MAAADLPKEMSDYDRRAWAEIERWRARKVSGQARKIVPSSWPERASGAARAPMPRSGPSRVRQALSPSS
jgi:hypothetical protein